MNKTNNKNTKIDRTTSKFWRYRIKIGLLAFILIIPITFIILLVLSSSGANKYFYFGTTKPETQLSNKDLTDLSDVTDFKLHINFYEVVRPKEHGTLNDGSLDLRSGQYKFYIYYSNANAKVSGLKASYLLQLPVLEQRSAGPVDRSLSTYDKTPINIDYNFILPARKGLKTYQHPDFYIKLNYTFTEAVGTTRNVELYIKYDLNKHTPKPSVTNAE